MHWLNIVKLFPDCCQCMLMLELDTTVLKYWYVI